MSVEFIANLSVGRKLLAGFAMVLLLTVAVAGTGFYAVETVLSRANQIQELAGINAAILNARGHERDYALNRSESAAAALRLSLIHI